jgi:hypothetical protein
MQIIPRACLDTGACQWNSITPRYQAVSDFFPPWS